MPERAEPEPGDWSRATFEGNRRRQHEEFLALPLAEKLARVEQMADIVRHFAARRASDRGGPGQPPPAGGPPTDSAGERSQ